jgi:multidrug efflux system membrane fusion protein
MRTIKQYQWLFVLIAGFFTAFNVMLVNAAGLATAIVSQSGAATVITVEGVVESVQSSVIAPQVAGSITALPVKVGDHINAGQMLARIDTRLAVQQVITSQAQVSAAQAQLSAARNEYERKRRLFEKQYISQSALERAESDYKTAEAQTKAQLAQTGMSSVQTGLHTINAPYAGVIAEVNSEVGDMAMPGKPLLVLYNPKDLRVVVNVPQSQLANLKQGVAITALIPAAIEAERNVTHTTMTILPTVDAVSNMVKVRLSLPKNLSSIVPGMFARASLPVNASEQQGQLLIPAKSVMKRSELMAVYVVDQKGNPHLRQVRLGRTVGEHIEVLAGLQAGEKVALDPITAANFK